jgi:hypothetical protein
MPSSKHLSEHEVYVTFYGGEPTLNLDFIKEIMARYPTFRFSSDQRHAAGWPAGQCPDQPLQHPAFHRRRRAITDGFPGRGVYRQVVKNTRRCATG